MPTPLEQLGTLLTRENEGVQAFLKILRQESDVLSAGGSAHMLADVVQAKWYRATALNTLRTERRAVLDSIGENRNMDALAAEYPEIRLAWTLLKPALEHARALNTENGVLIETLKKHTEDAMMVMRVASGQDAMYQADGRPASKAPRVLRVT